MKESNFHKKLPVNIINIITSTCESHVSPPPPSSFIWFLFSCRNSVIESSSSHSSQVTNFMSAWLAQAQIYALIVTPYSTTGYTLNYNNTEGHELFSLPPIITALSRLPIQHLMDSYTKNCLTAIIQYFPGNTTEASLLHLLHAPITAMCIQKFVPTKNSPTSQ